MPADRPHEALLKERITIRLARDVVERFRATGGGRQTRVDAMLQAGVCGSVGVAHLQGVFTVGLLSQLDLLLQMPLAAALESLRLSDEAHAALLQRSGPWAVYLELADALAGDDEELLEALSEPFGGSAVVLQEAEAAWAWAQQVAGLAGP